MEFWIDAQLPPHLAELLKYRFNVSAFHVFEFNFHALSDKKNFNLAKQKKDVVIITKDEDFANLVNDYGGPSKIIWLTIGNCTNKKLSEIISEQFPLALKLLPINDLIEITST